jgi:ADP-heptose:LPS heptosyltransferase
MADPLLKRLELALRRHVLRRWSAPATVLIDAPRPILQLDAGARVLLLRQDRIGDVLVSIPTIRVLRRHLPQVQFELLLSRNNWGVRHATAAYVQQWWLYRKSPLAVLGLLRRLQRRRYSAILDLTDNASVTSTLLLHLLDAPVKLGIAKENAAVYTHVVPRLDRARVHIVERIAQLLLPFGIDPTQETLDLEYPITPQEEQWALQQLGPCERAYRVGVNLSASHPDKYWGRENWYRFLALVQRRHPDAELLLFASPEYAREQRLLANALGLRAPQAHSFHEFALLLHTCDYIITPDTAAVHLAAAWKRPCLGLYVWDNPELLPWTPYRSPSEMVFTRQGSLRTLPVEEALQAFERLLQRYALKSPSS